ncbi:MAG: endonuclease MutS2 [Planctomycetota bacterium]|jgi:DNA mismatch repair protein MutS2
MAQKRIDEHTLKVLEFDQVRQILASFASSGLGKDAAAALYPSLDSDWINERIAETTELKNLLERGVAIPLAGLRDIGELIRGFGHGRTVFEPAQLLQIADTLAASVRIKKFLEELPADQAAHLRGMTHKLQDFTPIVDEINRCIEDKETVRKDASPKLLEISRRIEQLSTEIERRFRSIISSAEMRQAVENDKPLMRHGRVVVAVRTRYRRSLRGIVLDRSNTGATLYVEPEQLVELSNELEEATFARQKEIGRILWELTRAIIDTRKDILVSLKTLALFDLTYAKARLSVAYNMSPPIICPRFSLSLRQARHPLLLYCISSQKACEVSEAIDEVVPIDMRLGDDFDLLLVTGPNTGGKTVMLKTVGLLALMTQSGMHIPAHADSRVPVYGQIFADIGDEQSIQQSLSTFSAHISQIVRILRGTREAALILLDELGAGTDPVEGAVLATAILDGMLAKGGKVVATTHLGRLKSYAYTTQRAENASVQFDMETLKPTYKVRIGTPGSSNALAIARRLGMTKSIIRQARSLLEGEADGASNLINQVQATREDAERKRLQAQEMLDEAEETRVQALQRLEQLNHEREMLTDQTDREIDKSMHQVRQLVDGLVAQMQNVPKPWSGHVNEFSRQIIAAASSTPLAVRQAKFAESVRKGDTVYVTPFRRNGIVYRTNRKRGIFTLLVEGKLVQVPLTGIWEPKNP